MAESKIGPHLLGRKPSPPDERDYKLGNFLGTHADLVQAAYKELTQTTVGYKNKYWETPPAGTHWGQALAILGKISPLTPTPTPPPSPTPSSDVVFSDDEPTLDQQDTGHCVGFGWAQWGNTNPVDDHFTNDDGHAIYYECKVLDGEPKAEDGSYVRTGAKAMQNRGRLSVYAFASTVDEIKQYLQTKQGAVVVGTDWYNDMFQPDANFYVKPTGGVAGGHCFLLIGDLESEGAFEFHNSWGESWGDSGKFKMKYEDFATLLAANGEAVAAVELPLT